MWRHWLAFGLTLGLVVVAVPWLWLANQPLPETSLIRLLVITGVPFGVVYMGAGVVHSYIDRDTVRAAERAAYARAVGRGRYLGRCLAGGVLFGASGAAVGGLIGWAGDWAAEAASLALLGPVLSPVCGMAWASRVPRVTEQRHRTEGVR